jgi:hypothetical protein
MGEPPSGHTLGPATEYIGGAGGTGGTETSQYPEEEKSSEIPSVAASEGGGAQTGSAEWPAGLCAPGLHGKHGACCSGLGEAT